MNDRIKLEARPGSHTVYQCDDGTVVVEWYDFGDHAPYESANLLIFDNDGQIGLGQALGLPDGTSRDGLMRALGDRFKSYFQIREFVDAASIAYEHKVDFWP
jgi:hypothetical protein